MEDEAEEIQMRVDLQNMNIALTVERADTGDIDRMIAADDHWHCCRVEGCAHARLDVRVTRFGVGVNDIRVAHVDDVHIAGQINGIVLMIIGPRMPEAEQRRCLAHTARPETCTRTVLGARVERRTQNRHISIQLAPVRLIGSFAECRDPHERQVQPAALVPVSAHTRPPPFATALVNGARNARLCAPLSLSNRAHP